MITIRSDSRIFVTGKTGSGKTEFVKHRIWKLFHRRVYHDPKIENADLLELDKTTRLARTPAELLMNLNNGAGSILYQPANLERSDFDRVCEILYKWGNICLFVDEASFYTDSWSIEKWHKEIMVRGRSRNVGIVNLSQRPKEISNFLISESDHQFVFKLMLDSDIEKLKGIIPKRYHKEMYSMKLYHFLYNDISGNTGMHRPIRLPD